MSRRHPLNSQIDWFFAQHSVGLSGPIQVTPKDNPDSKGRKVTIAASAVCREGLVGGIRVALRKHMTRRSPGSNSWDPRLVLSHNVDLEQESLRQPGKSFLWVARAHMTSQRRKPHPKAGQMMPKPRYWYPWHGRWQSRYPKYASSGTVKYTAQMTRDFIDFCDAIIGPITVLLNPDRYTGDWWKTSVQEATSRKGQVRWYGIDNTALAHPALASLYTGLARQCALLTRVDLRDEILSCVDRGMLYKCLTESDPEAALVIARKMRRWIEVPRPHGGDTSNVPVPLGSFPKILALHKAIYQHGFEKTFGNKFDKGWGLTGSPYGYRRGNSGPLYRGIHSFMGSQGTNLNGQRIKELAKKKAA